jgi:hypothetical protein
MRPVWQLCMADPDYPHSCRFTIPGSSHCHGPFLFRLAHSKASHQRFEIIGFPGKEPVLPERIELSTSPLPRECSTTELRQPEAHAGAAGDTRGPAAWQGERPARPILWPVRMRPREAAPELAPGRRVSGLAFARCGRHRSGTAVALPKICGISRWGR